MLEHVHTMNGILTMVTPSYLLCAGSEASSKSLKLQDLRVHLGVPLVGSAHRAMSDVVVLSKVFPILTYILKLTLANLVAEQSFLLSDIDNPKKKKSSR